MSKRGETATMQREMVDWIDFGRFRVDCLLPRSACQHFAKTRTSTILIEALYAICAWLCLPPKMLLSFNNSILGDLRSIVFMKNIGNI